MPISLKLLAGVEFPNGQGTRAQANHAFERGCEAFEAGQTLADCPKEFMPKPGHGGDRLHDSFVCGFKTARLAAGKK